MKHLLLCSIVAAFTCASAQAGEDAKPKAATATCETACCSKKSSPKADSTAKGASQLLAKR